MKRRDALLRFAALAASTQIRSVAAQATAKIRRVGVLMGYFENDPAAQSRLAVFRESLAALGWSEGRYLRIDVRFADPGARTPELARELVAMVRCRSVAVIMLAIACGRLAISLGQLHRRFE